VAHECWLKRYGFLADGATVPPVPFFLYSPLEDALYIKLDDSYDKDMKSKYDGFTTRFLIKGRTKVVFVDKMNRRAWPTRRPGTCRLWPNGSVTDYYPNSDKLRIEISGIIDTKETQRVDNMIIFPYGTNAGKRPAIEIFNVCKLLGGGATPLLEYKTGDMKDLEQTFEDYYFLGDVKRELATMKNLDINIAAVAVELSKIHQIIRNFHLGKFLRYHSLNQIAQVIWDEQIEFWYYKTSEGATRAFGDCNTENFQDVFWGVNKCIHSRWFIAKLLYYSTEEASNLRDLIGYASYPCEKRNVSDAEIVAMLTDISRIPFTE